MPTVEERLAKRVQSHRERQGWNRRELAERADVDAATVTTVEAGRGAHVSTVVKLAEALGVMPGALLDAEREVA